MGEGAGTAVLLVLEESKLLTAPHLVRWSRATSPFMAETQDQTGVCLILRPAQDQGPREESPELGTGDKTQEPGMGRAAG